MSYIQFKCFVVKQTTTVFYMMGFLESIEMKMHIMNSVVYLA